MDRDKVETAMSCSTPCGECCYYCKAKCKDGCIKDRRVCDLWAIYTPLLRCQLGGGKRGKDERESG